MKFWNELHDLADGNEDKDPEPFAQEIKNEKIFYKSTFDAFVGADIDEYLKKNKIENIFFSGLITKSCIF